MTGFGSAELGGFRVEIRSLNHRFMDIYMRYPSHLSAYEMPLRDVLKKRFSRGKFDVYISCVDDSGASLRFNQQKAADVLESLRELGKNISLGDPDIRVDTLLAFKEFFIEDEAAYDSGELHKAFGEAVDSLHEMRAKEGISLVAEVQGLMGSIESLNDGIAEICPEILEQAKAKFIERFKDLLAECECDDGKLLQEASSVAEKADITEEVARIRTHLEHMTKIFKDGGSIGRKLDFLTQELYREVNTIASKSMDSRILSSVIQMKADIEKTKEQIQNIQ